MHGPLKKYELKNEQADISPWSDVAHFVTGLFNLVSSRTREAATIIRLLLFALIFHLIAAYYKLSYCFSVCYTYYVDGCV